MQLECCRKAQRDSRRLSAAIRRLFITDIIVIYASSLLNRVPIVRLSLHMVSRPSKGTDSLHLDSTVNHQPDNTVSLHPANTDRLQDSMAVKLKVDMVASQVVPASRA